MIVQIANTEVTSVKEFDAALARGRALRAALNQTLCEESAVLKDGDELAFFPPVTGG